MSPSLGRIVLVKLRSMGEPVFYNGSDEHPAIVTAVHSATMINARIFVDGNEPPLWQTSIPFEESAEGYSGSTWRWPPRIEPARES